MLNAHSNLATFNEWESIVTPSAMAYRLSTDFVKFSITSAPIEALHGHVTNTKFSKFLLKLLENFRALKNIARYTTFLILNFAY